MISNLPNLTMVTYKIDKARVMMAVLQVRKLRPQEIESLMHNPIASLVKLEHSVPQSQCSQSWWCIRVTGLYLR